VKYFVERFPDAPWGFYVFITDGELHDLEEVKRYSTRLAREIAAGRRRPMKLVLVGIGSQVNERQMEELDDLETGTNVDLWDHKLASELRVLQQIFAEVVETNARVADRGKILDPNGKCVRDFSDMGLPAFLDFTMPASAAYFTLDVNGTQVHQGLSDTATVPPSEFVASPKGSQAFDDIPEVLPADDFGLEPQAPPKPDSIPVAKPVGKPAAPKGTTPAKKDDDEWLGFDLEFEKNPPNIDLKRDGDDKK
jgi:hypothetical protein